MQAGDRRHTPDRAPSSGQPGANVSRRDRIRKRAAAVARSLPGTVKVDVLTDRTQTIGHPSPTCSTTRNPWPCLRVIFVFRAMSRDRHPRGSRCRFRLSARRRAYGPVFPLKHLT